MAKVQLVIDGKDQGAKAAVEGVTGSMVKANLIVEGLKIAFEALNKIISTSIEKYKETDLVYTKLRTVMGDATDDLANYNSELQKTTNIEDEKIASAQILGSNMGITTDKIKDATKEAIGLSEAFGIDLENSMKMVARAGEGDFAMMARYIPELKSATTESEKLAIMQEKAAIGLKMVEDKAQTFSGRLEQLKISQDELYESAGRLTAAVGKDIVSSMIDAADSMNSFINSKEGLDQIGNVLGTIGGTIAAIQEAVKPLGDILKGVFSTIGDQLKRFDELSDQSTKAGIGMQFLKGVAVGLGTALTLVGGTIGTVIGLLVDIIKLVQDAGSIFIKVFKGDFKGAAEEAQKFTDDLKNGIDNLADNVVNTVQASIESFKKLNTEIDPAVLQKKYDTAFKKIKNTVVNSMQQAGQEGADEFRGPMTEAIDFVAAFTSEQFKQAVSSATLLLSSLTGVTNQYYENEMNAAGVSADRKKELQREQFNVNKSLAAGNSVVSGFEAVAKALTAAPPPWNFILAGIVGAAAAVQTGLILSQPMPAFKKGGVSSGGVAWVGEEGPEAVELPAGARVRTAAESKAMRGNIYITIERLLTNDPAVFVEGMRNVARLEASRA